MKHSLEQADFNDGKIIQEFDFKSQRKEYIDYFLKKCLWVMVGYYRYIIDSDINSQETSNPDDSQNEPIKWNDIAFDLNNLIDTDWINFFEEEEDYTGDKYIISFRLRQLLNKIQSILYEDEEGFGKGIGFKAALANKAIPEGYDLINLLPYTNIETDTTMEIKYALQRLSNFIRDI